MEEKVNVDLKKLVDFIISKTGHKTIVMENVAKIIHHASAFILFLDYFNIWDLGII